LGQVKVAFSTFQMEEWHFGQHFGGTSPRWTHSAPQRRQRSTVSGEFHLADLQRGHLPGLSVRGIHLCPQRRHLQVIPINLDV
jgi:hypothetical protein